MSHGLNILVVDDDRDNADSLAELFEIEGHTVQVAYSGQAAIDAYVTASFDLAFMDVMMPGKNGLESFLEIKRLRPGAKVYMMTGYSVEQLLQLAMANGALGVFNKPCNIREILAGIEAARPNGIVVVPEAGPEFTPRLRESIEAAGQCCAVATSEHDAHSHAAAVGNGTLILDIGQPLIDGIDIYTSLRKSGEATPAVVMTTRAVDHTDMFEALSDIEVTGVLNKPFDPSKLLDKLRRLAA